jgi:hypothetical protein
VHLFLNVFIKKPENMAYKKEYTTAILHNNTTITTDSKWYFPSPTSAIMFHAMLVRDVGFTHIPFEYLGFEM